MKLGAPLPLKHDTEPIRLSATCTTLVGLVFGVRQRAVGLYVLVCRRRWGAARVLGGVTESLLEIGQARFRRLLIPSLQVELVVRLLDEFGHPLVVEKLEQGIELVGRQRH
jgi:hypothetical protein